jgi:hypothetical protein
VHVRVHVRACGLWRDDTIQQQRQCSASALRPCALMQLLRRQRLTWLTSMMLWRRCVYGTSSRQYK